MRLAHRKITAFGTVSGAGCGLLPRLSLWSIIILSILLMTVPVQGKAQSTLLVLGDSLSAAYNIPADQGWVQLLEQRLHQRDAQWQVVNASISGETSGGGAARIEQLLQNYQPAVLIVELGGNDGLRGLPIGQFRENMTTIINQARQSDVKVLIAGIQIPSNYGPLYRRRFEAVYTELSERFHVPLVPFLLAGIALNPELMQNDGIHPTAQAQPRIIENLWPFLAPLMGLEEPLGADAIATQAR